MTCNYAYFDEAYYQDGVKRGTVYNDYLNTAPHAPVYKEIAEAIAATFRPKRCLEIGCATGPIVKHLNDMGIEAHGIDPSEWAVKHRLHDNVTVAGAEHLPYPDEHFDLVFSCHSLEHIPLHLKDAAFSELGRVCGEVQFHMLPILGESNYAGDIAKAIEILKRDKSHHLLLNRTEWLAQFSPLGWETIGDRIAFRNDSQALELSTCQFILRKEPSIELSSRIAQWNFNLFESAFHEMARARVASTISLAELQAFSGRKPVAELVFADSWRDAVFIVPAEIDLTGATLRVAISVESESPIDLRIALLTGAPGDPSTSVLEAWDTYPVGASVKEFPIAKFKRLRGTLDAQSIVQVMMGGSAQAANVRFVLTLRDLGGESVIALHPTEARRQSLVLEEEVAALRATVEKREAELRAIFSSRRWKVTAPVSRALTALKQMIG